MNAMSSPLYSLANDTFTPLLRTLSTLLDKGAEHAKSKGFDTAVLVNARLAPDMFPLSKQVQIACDFAKNALARLSGQEPKRFEDTEQTLDELKDRIARALAYMATFDAAAFEDAASRNIVIPLPGDMVLEMTGEQYLRDWALPHFYFHLVTAYDILRHNGVPIGKLDYLAHVEYAIRKKEPELKTGT